MTVLAFDTHAFVKRLTGAGMPEAQAEILADEQTKLIDEKLATKADLAATELRLEAKIDDVKSELIKTELRLEVKIEAVKSDLIKWVVGSFGFQTLIMLGAVIALVKIGHG